MHFLQRAAHAIQFEASTGLVTNLSYHAQSLLESIAAFALHEVHVDSESGSQVLQVLLVHYRQPVGVEDFQTRSVQLVAQKV